MKKIIAFLFALIIILSMAIQAFALTPKWEYKAIKLPEIKVENIIPQSFWDNYFKENPLNIKISFTSPSLK